MVVTPFALFPASGTMNVNFFPSSFMVIALKIATLRITLCVALLRITRRGTVLGLLEAISGLSSLESKNSSDSAVGRGTLSFRAPAPRSFHDFDSV